MKFILLMFLTTNVLAIEHRNLKEDTSQLSLSTGFYTEEKSYEKDSNVIDETNQKGYLQTISYKSAYNDRFTYEIEVKALLGGTYSEVYSGPLEFIPNKKSESYGLREPTFKLYYLLKSPKQEFTHSVFTSLAPKIIEAQAHLFYLGRTEFTLSYLFSYRHNSYEINGELFTTIFGKKEIRLDSGAEDTIESFTEAGIKFSPGYYFNKFSVHLLSSYSSMTDYNTQNQHFERHSDKGYAVEIGARIDIPFSNKYGISFSYLERESYFNSIEEDITRNVEYEIDSEEFKITWWTFL